MRLLLVTWILLTPVHVAAQNLEQEIRSEVLRFVETMNGGDPAALAGLYVTDATVGSLGDGQITTGWRGVSELFREFYREYETVHMAVDGVAVTALGTDAAVAYFRYHWTIGSGETLTGAMTLVFRRSGSGWKVAHDHTSTLVGEPTSSGPDPTPAAMMQTGPPGPARATTDCVVTRIVDGDTIECRDVGRVRLIGMDTPEMSQEPYGSMATRALAEIVPTGAEVQLEPDVEPRDQYGRVLAYVWSNGALSNWQMVRGGWAVVLTYPPNVQYVEWFEDAQRLARQEGAGLWAAGGFSCLPQDRRRGRCE